MCPTPGLHHSFAPDFPITGIPIRLQDELIKRIAQQKTPLTEYIVKYAERGVPLWDELTVGIFLDPTLIRKETAVYMDVDLNHGVAYGTARIWSDSLAPHLGERKANFVQDVDVNRFVDEFVSAMQAMRK